jgi:hypothetical protein
MAADPGVLGSARARASALIAGVALVAALLALCGRTPASGPSEQSFALSPQECNTQCQTRKTDCIDACDGHIPCEKGCVASCEACVQRCLHPPDAGAGGASGAGGAGGRGRRR